MKRGYLVLQNGRVFEGERFGADGEVRAQLTFTTGMGGYLETLTDPGFYGQMVMHTFPLIGNYGVIPDDCQGEAPKLCAYIVREVCEAPSNFRSQGRLSDYLARSGVIGLHSIDTRALTRILRDDGEMNAAILDELPSDMAAFTQELAAYSLPVDLSRVACTELYEKGSGDVDVVVWDFGAKRALIDALVDRGLSVTVVPPGTTADEILALNPDGVLLSDGPGDPAAFAAIISEIAKLERAPTMGVGLGHTMLALAHGGRVIKLKCGHHGANQPVKRTADGRLFTTGQRHSYVVSNDALPLNARLSYENVNDQTVEGIEYDAIPAFSVQFDPTSRDVDFLFDQFIQMMEG